MNHIEKNHKKTEDKNETQKKNQEEETALYRDMSVLMEAAENEDDKEATEISEEADKFEEMLEEERLGISAANTMSLNLDEIQAHALPAALEPVETNDKPVNNKDVIDLVNNGNKKLEKFLLTTKVSLTNEALVEVPNTVIPPPNSAASQYMNKSLSVSQRLLFPEANFLVEMAEKEDEMEDEKETEKEAGNDSAGNVVNSIAEDILSKIVINMDQELNIEEHAMKEKDKTKTKENKTMIKCRRCKFTTETIKELVKHTKKKHTCQYKCRKCKQSFMLQASLNKHTTKRHPEIEIVESAGKSTLECQMKDEVIKHKKTSTSTSSSTRRKN